MGILGGLAKIWSQDMAIDLGTANTLVASANAYINALNKMIIKRNRNFAPENTEIKQNLKTEKMKGI